MSVERRKQEYLQEAMRAEAHARAALTEIRESWLRIAELYRQMAQEQRDHS